MDKAKLREGIQKYSMIIVLVLVTLFFTWGTQGKILFPQNITNLISQNAYVYVLATGMLLCILTGGNIDLSVGSVVCFVGAVDGYANADCSDFDVITWCSHRCMAGCMDRIRTCTSIHYHTVRYVCIPWFIKRSSWWSDTSN